LWKTSGGNNAYCYGQNVGSVVEKTGRSISAACNKKLKVGQGKQISEMSNKKPKTGARVIKGSFWVIAAVHIAVFTAIGVATGRWRLLAIFIVGFVATLAIWAGVKIILARRK
jgi:hypothetical protein